MRAGEDSPENKLLTLRSGDNLASVRNGALYAVDEYPGLVAKIYDIPDDDIEEKLRVMIATRPDIPEEESERVSIAWPVDILKDAGPSGRVVGLLIPRFSGSRLEDIFALSDQSESRDGFTEEISLEAARNISRAVDILHEGPHVIGDFDESRVLISDSGAVTLIDTDLFQISARQSQGGKVYRSRVGRGEYTPRELQDSGRFGVTQREKDHDLFALAVFIYKLMMGGVHPFDGEYTSGGDPPPLRVRIESGQFLHSKIPG